MLIGYNFNPNRIAVGFEWVNEDIIEEGITTYFIIYLLCFEFTISHGDSDTIERMLNR